ncbi:MAG: DUF882 domain-containing protein [Pseudomonadota bacterium]
MHKTNRRQFLKMGMIAAASAAPFAAFAAPRKIITAEKSLSFYNTHTGEKIKAVYWADGDYQRDGLADINRVLRDHRNDQIKEISPALLDFLHNVGNEVDANQAIHIISGYRSPATNTMLAERSGGVARHSMHLEGKAIDIRVPGRDLSQVRAAALKLQGGGVGYYPRSNFVHLDVSRVRQWQG